MDAEPKLPPPSLANWTWQVQAACRGLNPAVFFPTSDESTMASRAAQIKRAKAVCERCPVVAECLAYALQTREPYGVWGGRSESERADLLGLDSLRYPARRTRPRRWSAASRREAWRASADRRSAFGPPSTDRPPAAEPAAEATPVPTGMGSNHA